MMPARGRRPCRTRCWNGGCCTLEGNRAPTPSAPATTRRHPALLDLCDRLGLLVMDEAFDEFTPGKNKWVNARNRGAAQPFRLQRNLRATGACADIQDLRPARPQSSQHHSLEHWQRGGLCQRSIHASRFSATDYPRKIPRRNELVTCARTTGGGGEGAGPHPAGHGGPGQPGDVRCRRLAGLLDAAGYNYQESRYAEDNRQYPRPDHLRQRKQS